MNFLDMFLNVKSKHIINVAIGRTERKQGKLTCESIHLGNH